MKENVSRQISTSVSTPPQVRHTHLDKQIQRVLHCVERASTLAWDSHPKEERVRKTPGGAFLAASARSQSTRNPRGERTNHGAEPHRPAGQRQPGSVRGCASGRTAATPPRVTAPTASATTTPAATPAATTTTSTPQAAAKPAAAAAHPNEPVGARRCRQRGPAAESAHAASWLRAGQEQQQQQQQRQEAGASSSGPQ